MIDVRKSPTATFLDLRQWLHDVNALDVVPAGANFPLLVQQGSSLTEDGAMYVYGAGIHDKACYLVGVPIAHVHRWDSEGSRDSSIASPTTLASATLNRLAREHWLYTKVAGDIPLTVSHISAFLESFEGAYASASAYVVLAAESDPEPPASIVDLQCMAFSSGDPLVMIGYHRSRLAQQIVRTAQIA